MRPGTGNKTREDWLGLMPTRPGASTSSVGTSSVFTVSTRICDSCGEPGAMLMIPGAGGATSGRAAAAGAFCSLRPQAATALTMPISTVAMTADGDLIGREPPGQRLGPD